MAEHTGEHHIEVDDLMVHYGDVMAIKGVGFAVRWGEHLILLGPSGGGKTTTLRAIAGLEQPSAGEIRIGGQVVYSSTQRVNVPTEKRGVSSVANSGAIVRPRHLWCSK
jgi:iron(III) transport system ATP-binding protein